MEKITSEGYTDQNPFPTTHGYSVTVPGAAAAWVDTVQLYGSKKVIFLLGMRSQFHNVFSNLSFKDSSDPPPPSAILN